VRAHGRRILLDHCLQLWQIASLGSSENLHACVCRALAHAPVQYSRPCLSHRYPLRPLPNYSRTCCWAFCWDVQTTLSARVSSDRCRFHRWHHLKCALHHDNDRCTCSQRDG
jgi:hypothetical protein